MPLESNVNGIEDLNAAWPTATDPKSEGDDHLRNTKLAVQGTFPNTTGAWTTTNEITHADATVDTASATLGQAKTEIDDAIAADKALRPVISQGNISGSTGTGGGSGDWTGVKESVGQFLITFDTVAANSSISIAPYQEGGERTFTVQPVGDSQWRVYIRDGAGSLVDNSFSFNRIVYL